MDQNHKAGDTFDESSYRRTVPGPHDAVSFPVPDLHPVLNLSRSISDHRHVGDPAGPLQSLQLPAGGADRRNQHGLSFPNYLLQRLRRTSEKAQAAKRTEEILVNPNSRRVDKSPVSPQCHNRYSRTGTRADLPGPFWLVG